MNGISEVEKAEELVSKIMFLLNAPAQRIATAILNALEDGFFEVVCQECGNARLPLRKGEKPSAEVRYTCKECCRDATILNTPTSEIEKVLEGKSRGQKRRIYEALASTRASRGPYIVEYPNGHFGYSEGGYKPYRRKKAKETAARWRKNNPPERAAEYKRRYRKGDRRDEFRAAPVDSAASDAAWESKLKEFDYACSDCRQPLILKTAIRWPSGPTYVPVCSRCRGKKAAEERWRKRKAGKSSLNS